MGIQVGSTNPVPVQGAFGTRQFLDYKAAAIGVVVLESANLSRAHGGVISNNSNCDVVVCFGDNPPLPNVGMPQLPKLATVASAIPSNIDIPEDYKGQIQILFLDPGNKQKPTGGVNLMEFIYIDSNAISASAIDNSK